MLVLTRRAGESIVIGDDVTVTVLEMRGDQIRIGIDAPRHIKVNRQEVVEQVEQTNAEAAQSAARARTFLQQRRTQQAGGPQPVRPTDDRPHRPAR